MKLRLFDNQKEGSCVGPGSHFGRFSEVVFKGKYLIQSTVSVVKFNKTYYNYVVAVVQMV